MSQIKSAHLIANPKSGKGLGAQLPAMARGIAERHGATLIHYDTGEGNDFDAQVEKAVAAAKKDGGVVIAAGGDGTIRSVAQRAAEQSVKFAAVPTGTFNFFARAHRISEEPEVALNGIFTGEIRAVRLGRLNNHYFLINASFGLYARSIEERERTTKRWGRDRLIVILSTMRTLLRRHKLIGIDLMQGGKTVSLTTASVFIGNNALQLRDLSMDVAKCMGENLLAVVVLKPVGRRDMIRIFWRGLAKTLEDDHRLKTFCADALTIRLPVKKIKVALDGEIFYVESPIRVSAEPEALKMVVPALVEHA